MSNSLSIILALLTGLTMAFQGAVNSLIGKTAGQFVMVIGVSAIQIMISATIVLTGDFSLNGVFNPWMVFAGILGVVIMLGLSLSIGSIGALNVVVLILVGQVIASMFIDQLGLFGVPQTSLNLQRILSCMLIIVGAYGLLRS